MAYTTIFFDLDGTLIDPKDSITKSVQYTLSKFGIKEEADNLTYFIGPTLNESLEKYYGFDEEQIKKAVVYYLEYFREHGIPKILLYNGIVELLQKLKEKNKNISIVSTKFKTSAQKIVETHKLTNYFDNIVGALPDLSNADKPTLVKEALALYPEQPKNSFVMIGDREHDIIGAQANGIDSIGVLYGYGTEEEMEKIKPTHIAKAIEELQELLTNVR